MVCADDIVQGKWPFSRLAEQTCFSFQSLSQIMQTFKGKFCLLVTISSGSITARLADRVQPAPGVQKRGFLQPRELLGSSV